MEEFYDNTLLKILHNVFKDYSGKDRDYITKLDLLRLFYDYKIIDTCGYNIFNLNAFMNQLNPNEDKITLKMFLILIFYIYRTEYLSSEEKSETSVDQVTVNDINKIIDDRLQIYSTNNIIKIILNQKDQRISAYTFESPDFDNEDIQYICSYELLTFLSNYMKSIENIMFEKYSTSSESKSHSNTENNNKKNEITFKYVNIAQINTLIFDYPIFKNFNCDTIAEYLSLFITEISKNQWNLFKSIFDERMESEKITKIFDSLLLNANEINFTYSSLVILLTQFALKLKSSEGKTYQEAIEFLFEGEFGLKSDNADLNEKLEEEKEEEPDFDYIPESETLNNAKTKEHDKEDTDFINEFLTELDKILPPPDTNILSFKNDNPFHSNNITTNKYEVVPAKFPLETLEVEVNEKKAKDLLERENRQIDRAKKTKKRNARDPPPKEIYMKDLPNKETYETNYRGKRLVDTLTERLIKKTYKEILPNSNVYPSLIKEALIVPVMLPSKVKEIIVESYKDQIKGFLEISIRRLEKAENLLRDSYKTDEAQCDLFFNLNFGALYESLGYHIVAFRYYFHAKQISDKLLVVDPDTALVYSFLGGIFLKLQEFEWSMRCYQKAKELRENTIGGDTLDTAAIYNNLGVVSFYMESFLPAKNYFNLAYEITRKILGLRHTRTLMIKSNMTKLSQLSFNKLVEFKTLGLYETPAQLMKNPKRKKK